MSGSKWKKVSCDTLKGGRCGREIWDLYILFGLQIHIHLIRSKGQFGFSRTDSKRERKMEMAIFKRKKSTTFTCPIGGFVASVDLCPDEYFSKGLMGKGIVIFPTNNVFYAPVDARVRFVFASKNALGLETADGIQCLIHAGIDTNRLEGRGFEMFVKEGDMVSQGDRLIAFDDRVLEQAGYDSVSPFVFCNVENMKLRVLKTGKVRANEQLIVVEHT